MMMKTVVAALMLAVSFPAAAVAEAQLFEQLDTDKSGTISRTELLKGDLAVVSAPDGTKRVQRRDPAATGQNVLTEGQKRRLFDTLDRDKNGFISRKEWQRAAPGGFILWKF